MKKIVELVCSFYYGHRKKLLIMRNAVLILLISAFQVLATGSYSQTAQLSLKLKDATIKEVLTEIENQSEFYFLYNSELIDVTRKVDISVKNEKVNDILSRLFSKDEVNVSISDRHIVLTPVTEMSEQQTKSVSGKVTDVDGQPLPGVSVVVKGTTNGTVTNADGNFTISNISENAVLQFSFVGMKGQEVVVGNQTSINVSMVEETVGIEEVVAIGYGTVKKRDLTGSVSSVKAEDLVKQPISAITEALNGKIAGVKVTSASGAPGGGLEILIRGANSISGNNSPLYVIDGVPFSNQGASQDVDHYRNPLSVFNPEDIESLEILKDASATAIYGSRGANGVVLITTKKGASGKTNIEFSSTFSLQEQIKKYEMLGIEDFTLAWEDIFTNTAKYKGTLNANEQNVRNILNDGIGTNMRDKYIQVAPMQNYQLSVSGGCKNTTYLVSANYLNQEGIVIGSGFERLGLRTNIQTTFNKYVDAGLITNLTHNQYYGEYGNSTGSEWTGGYYDIEMWPEVITEKNDLNKFITNNPLLDGAEIQNPSTIINNVTRDENFYKFWGTIFINIKPTEYLTFKSQFGSEVGQNHIGLYTPEGTTRYAGQNYAMQSQNWSRSMTIENTLTFNKEFGAHNITALIGQTAEKATVQGFNAANRNFPTDAFLYYGLQAGESVPETINGVVIEKTNMTVGSSYNNASLLSFIGRLNYSLLDKYLLTATFRADGSSKLSKRENNNWDYFPSAALAWRLGNEDFIKDLNIFSNLKLRFGYGVVGSQAVPTYSSISTYQILRNSAGTGSTLTNYVFPNKIPNLNLTWEKTYQSNIGLDYGFINNRIEGSIEFYKKLTENLLLDIDLDAATGYSSYLGNAGSIENKGIEFTLNTRNFVGKFKWTSNFNIAFQKNEVVDLGPNEQIFNSPNVGRIKVQGSEEIGITRVGEPFGSFFGIISNGIAINESDFYTQPKIGKSTFPTSGIPVPGFEKYIDLNGDGIITSEDRAIIGNAQPKIFGGFNNTFSYKIFDLLINMEWLSGNQIFNGSRGILDNNSMALNVRQDFYDNRFTEFGKPAQYPMFVRGSNVTVPNRSELIENGSYFRIKNINLAINIPKKITQRILIDNAKITLGATNLLTFTNYSGIDPDINSNGTSDNFGAGYDLLSYPSSKVYSFGIQLNF